MSGFGYLELTKALGSGPSGAAQNLSEWLVGISQLEAGQGEKFEEVREHEIRVARSAAMFAREIGMDRKGQTEAFIAGRFHDIGKTRIPREILFKPGVLTPEEREVIENHTVLGEDILLCSAIPTPRFLFDAILYHHERYDGLGYYKMKGEEIPFISRLLAIADVHDALTAKRVYKSELKEWEALLMMTREHPKFGRSAFDPVLLRQFVKLRLKMVRSIPPGQRAALEKFVTSNPNHDLGPEAMVSFHDGHRKVYVRVGESRQHVATIENNGHDIRSDVDDSVFGANRLNWISQTMRHGNEHDFSAIIARVI